MHTQLSTWLAVSAALWPTVTAFYPYQYDDGSTKASSSRRSARISKFDSGPITLPLRRVPATLLSRQRNTYNIVDSKDPGQKNSVAIDQDGSDLSYMVAVKIGDSKEEYHLLLDSAASNTWVMGQDCKSEACRMHNTFGSGDSSSLKVRQASQQCKQNNVDSCSRRKTRPSASHTAPAPSAAISQQTKYTLAHSPLWSHSASRPTSPMNSSPTPWTAS